MWNQSENARLQQELQDSGLTGQALLRKFHTGPRESLRLAAALRGIFTVGCAGEAEKREYWAYLARRLVLPTRLCSAYSLMALLVSPMVMPARTLSVL